MAPTVYRPSSHSLIIPILIFFLFGCSTGASPQLATGSASNLSSKSVSTVTQNRGKLIVFAAASLTEPFGEIGRLFEAENPGVKVDLNFGGSQQLRSQMEQGARADVFASANNQEMDKARQANLVGEPRIFARNVLVVILPKDNPGRITRLEDLSRSGLKIDVAQRDVPAGAYTLTVLDKMANDPSFGVDFKNKVLGNVRSEEESVKRVVTKVQLGEVDAGLVYATDIAANRRPDITIIAIPPQFNVIAEYPLAVAKEYRSSALGQAFVDLVLSTKGQAVLARSGFIIEGQTNK